MENKQKFHYRILEYAGLLVLLGLLFWRIRHAVFGAQEEYGLFYIAQKGDFFPWLESISKETGRVTFYILSWFWVGPMFFSDPIVYKLSMYILILLDFVCFFWLLKSHVNRRFAVFATAFILIMMQISHQHNLLITYNYLHIPFILLMVSMHLILNYCKGRSGYGAMIGSAVCSFAASFFQENFVLFYLFCFAIVLRYEKDGDFWKKVWHSLWKLKFHVLGGAIFLMIYFSFRISCSMGSYGGNTLCLSQPLTSLKVLLAFMTGMLPGRSFFEVADKIGYGAALAFLGKKDIVVVIAGVIFLCWLLYRTPKFKKSIYLYGALLFASILACALHAVSLQYITWVSEGHAYAYVPSYYSVFFLNTILCLIVHNVYTKTKGRWKSIVLVLFAVASMGLSMMTVITNKYYDREYEAEFNHYENYREYFNQCGIETWEDGAQVLIEDDYPVDLQLVHQAMTTVRYDAYYFTVTKNMDEIDQNETYYVLQYEDDGIKMKVQ